MERVFCQLKLICSQFHSSSLHTSSLSVNLEPPMVNSSKGLIPGVRVRGASGKHPGGGAGPAARGVSRQGPPVDPRASLAQSRSEHKPLRGPPGRACGLELKVQSPCRSPRGRLARLFCSAGHQTPPGAYVWRCEATQIEEGTAGKGRLVVVP